MAKRVLTGCMDCKRCTNSGAANAGRRTGRGLTAIATGGLSEAARVTTKNCKACGHKLSVHASTTTLERPSSTPPPSGARPATSLATPRATFADSAATSHRQAIAKYESKAAERAAIGNHAAAARALKIVERHRRALSVEEEPAETSALEPLAAATTRHDIDHQHPAEDVNDRPTDDLAAQLASLHALYESGALTVEEFAAAKTRVLGL